MGSCLCSLLTQLLIQSHLAHIMFQKRCPHSCLLEQWVLNRSFTDPKSFAFPVPCPYFYSVFCVSSRALPDCRVGNTLPLTLPSSSRFPFENNLLNQPLQTSQLAFLRVEHPFLCFLVNCSIITLFSHENEA